MRSTFLSLGLAVTAAALATYAGAGMPDKVVYLDGAADLSELRATNPDHYARAQRVLGAAGELCRPKPGDVSFARLNARNVSCTRMLLKTSNPPKRVISFTLDDTRYIALVVVTDDPPRLVPAH
jgi:hypothetical protein